MANLCDTQYKITGEKKAVADLWNTLQEMNVNEKNIWLGDLANHYGIDYKAKGFSVRGEIYWAEYEEYSDYALLSFDTETAWCEIGTFQFHPKSESSKNRNLLLILMIFSKNTRR